MRGERAALRSIVNLPPSASSSADSPNPDRDDTWRARAEHWQEVYRQKAANDVSWYRPHLEASLELIEATGVGRTARILDVGGGASTLVDDLLAGGFAAITVLDVSGEALGVARRRLGAAAASVDWVEGDISRIELLAAGVDVWHDRATLHFLTDADDRRRYVRQLQRTLVPGGHAILATFAPDGPPRCSNLPVLRYNETELQELLGSGFLLRQARTVSHRTPANNEQAFTYGWFSHEPDGSPLE